MALPVWMDNLVSYSIQIAILAAAGTLLAYLFRLRTPRVTLVYWQVLLAACLFVFALQEWSHPVYHPAPPEATMEGLEDVMAFPAAAASPGFRLEPKWIGWILAGGILLRLLWLALGLMRLRSFRHKGYRLPEEPVILEETELLVRIRASVLFSDAIDSPVTFGMRHPVIILPERFIGLSAERQKAVLCHELLHIRRRDWVFIIMEELVHSVFWFHPAIWWLLAKIRLSREQAVDSEVVRLSGDRQPYLDSLLEFARAQGRPKQVPAPLFLKERHLVERVTLLLKEASMSRSRLFVSLAAISVLLLATVQLASGWFPLTGKSVVIQAPEAKTGVSLKQKPVAVRVPVDESEALPKPVQINPTRVEIVTAAAANILPSPPEAVPAPVQALASDFGREPIRVGGNVQESKLIRKVDPVYPEEAKRARITGSVIMTVTVDKEGNVTDVKVNAGHPLLTDAAITAVKQWKYSPTLLNGMPVPVITTVTCVFNMTGDNYVSMHMDESGNLTAVSPASDIESLIPRLLQGGVANISIAPNTPLRVAESVVHSLQQRGVKTIKLSGQYTLYEGRLFYNSRPTSVPQFAFDFQGLNGLLEASGWTEAGKPKMLRYLMFINEVGEIVGVLKQVGPDNPEIDRELMRTRVIAPAMLGPDPIPCVYFFTINAQFVPAEELPR